NATRQDSGPRSTLLTCPALGALPFHNLSGPRFGRAQAGQLARVQGRIVALVATALVSPSHGSSLTCARCGHAAPTQPTGPSRRVDPLGAHKSFEQQSMARFRLAAEKLGYETGPVGKHGIS